MGENFRFTLDFKYEVDGFGVTQFTDINTTREKLPGEIQKWIHKIRVNNGYRDLTISIALNSRSVIIDNTALFLASK